MVPRLYAVATVVSPVVPWVLLPAVWSGRMVLPASTVMRSLPAPPSTQTGFWTVGPIVTVSSPPRALTMIAS